MTLLSCCGGQSRTTQKQDGLWSFLVLVCTFLQPWLLIGIARGYGIYLPFLMDEFNVGRDKIALVGSLGGGLSFLLTILATWLNYFIDSRIVSGVGHLSLSIAFTVSSFVHHVEVLFLTYSVFLAIGTSLCLSTQVLVIAKYFKKHRSLAQGINSSGGALGIMTVPNILQYFLDSVGWRNTFRVQAAVVFLWSFLCMAFSPNVEKETNEIQDDTHVISTKAHTNNSRARKVHVDVVSSELEETSGCNTSAHYGHQNMAVEYADYQSQQIKNQDENNDLSEELTLKENINGEEGEHLEEGTKQSLQREDHNSQKNLPTEKNSQVVANNIKSEAPAESQKVVSLRGIFDMSVWRVPTYTFAVFSNCGASFVMFSFSVHLVKFSEEKAGLSGRSATTLYIFLGLTSFTARIFSGKICDFACIKPSMVHMTSELLAAINMYLLTLSKSYLHLAILTCVHGLADGMFRTTSVVLLTTCVPRSKSASAYGQGNSLVAPFLVAGPAITGLLADAFNGYTEAYYLNGNKIKTVLQFIHAFTCGMVCNCFPMKVGNFLDGLPMF